MALASNITRRIGSKNYHARVTVPKYVQDKLRKKEIWKSLETQDPAEAKRRARSILAACDREFSRLRATNGN